MNYQARLHAVLKKMHQENADWFMVTNLVNVRYLSGFTGSYATLLIHADKQYILTDGRYQEQVAQEVKHFEPVIQGTRKETQAIKDTLGDISNQVLWFEGEHYSVSRYQALKKQIAAKSYLAKQGIVEQLRAVKEENEIKALRQALKLAENAFDRALHEIKEGMTERDLARFLLDDMWNAGAVKESFDPLVLFGPRSSMCHGKPTHNPLKKGDIVLMDFGCLMADGYQSDITRTVFFGKPTDEQKSMYQCVLEANQAAEDHLQAGVSGVEGDEYARASIRKAGREDQFIHGLGHGVGLEIHEAPRLSPLSEHTLVAGHVVTVEPGVYIEGTGGIRIEDMVIIREKDCEVMNQATKEMIVL